MENKLILIILDGWGHGKNPAVSAIAQAKTPFVDSLYRDYPNAELVTFGEEVGLPEGQMGNSEVGHLNIGAGRIVYQEFARINKAVREKTLHKHPILLRLLAETKKNGRQAHFIGLVSDGGVHSHINHLKALCDIAETHGPTNSFIHAFTDGRDVDPHSGKDFIEDLENHLSGKKTKIASVIGRYYAMDRDQRWERIQLAYDLLVNGKGKTTTSAKQAVLASYKAGVSDEFIQPVVCVDEEGKALGKIQEGDLVICFNFRTDRPRQITKALTQQDFPDFGMKKLPLRYATMTNYDSTFEGIEVLFTKENLKNTLGEMLEKAGKTQVRIAETEKYPHVTYFFSGGREAEFKGESRIMIPSPKVATYDLQPSMSAEKMTTAIIEKIQAEQPNFICLNYANTDMVGHTGIFPATVKAAEVVDDCLSRLVPTTLQQGYAAMVIADHGNSELMVNEDGSPNTAHTVNLVPCFFVSKAGKKLKLLDGKLGDLSPTILHYLGIPAPKEMTGKILIQKQS